MKLSRTYLQVFSIFLMLAVMATSLRVHMLAGALDSVELALEEDTADGKEKSPESQEGEEERESKKEVEAEDKGWLENINKGLADHAHIAAGKFIYAIENHKDSHHPSVLIPPPDFI